MVYFLIVCLIATPAMASSQSDKFWQEFDVTFWQTIPFAAIFGYFIDRQLSSIMFPGSVAHWQAIVPFAIAVSAGNAYIYAQKKEKEEVTDERAGDRL